jgi:hypothetical protein
VTKKPTRCKSQLYTAVNSIFAAVSTCTLLYSREQYANNVHPKQPNLPQAVLRSPDHKCFPSITSADSGPLS